MAKVSFFSPVTHQLAAEEFCRWIGCNLEMGEVQSWPGTERQDKRTFRMVLTSEQARRVRETFGALCQSNKLDTIIKGTVDGYKASLDKDFVDMRTPTSGMLEAGRELRRLRVSERREGK